jgi:predicted HD superfamily hydrolase involved in NAD metabolism
MGLSIIDETSVQDLLVRARNSMTCRRFMHVLGVMHTLNTLADIHGLCLFKATMVSLLHDLSKELEPGQIRSDLKRRGLDIPQDDLDSPKIWHGYHASIIAEQELGISDREILEAVALHTTADADIQLLTRAVFIADFCEPGRRIDTSPEILHLAKTDLDQGFRGVLLRKTAHMMKRKDFNLSPRTQRAVKAWLPRNWNQTTGSLMIET